MSYYRNQLEDWLKTIDVKCDRCIDIGGGANPVKDRVKSWDIKEELDGYIILDNNLEEQKQVPGIIFDLNDDIQKYWRRGGILNIFDLAFCLETMEYIWNPVQALWNINALMKENGILYISFPFVYPHHNPAGQDFLRYTRWGVEKLLNETGFEILELVPRTEKKPVYNKDKALLEGQPEMLTSFYSKEGMHPCREYNGHNEIGYLCKCKKI